MFLTQLRTAYRVALLGILSYLSPRVADDAVRLLARLTTDLAAGRYALDVLNTLGDSTSVGVVLSTVGSFGALLGDVSVLGQVALYAVGIYTVLPSFVDGDRREVLTTTDVRASVALWCAITAMYFTKTSGIGAVTSIAFVALSVVAAPTHLLLLLQRHGPDRDGRNHYVLTIVEMTGADPDEIHAEYDPEDRRSTAMFAYIAGLVLALVAVVLGGFVTIFVAVYPLIEVTAIGIGLLTLVDAHAPVDVFRTPSDRIEGNFFAIVSHAPKTPFRASGVFGMFITGIIAAAIPLIAVVSAAMLGGLKFFAELLSLRGFVVAQYLVGGIGYGIYGLLYWRRIAARFPAFVRTEAGEGATTDTARLPGGMIVPSAAVVLVALLTVLQALVIHYTGRELVPWWFLVVDVVVLVGGLAYLFRRYEVFAAEVEAPQPPSSDAQAIPRAWTTQVVALVVAVWLVLSYRIVVDGGLGALPTALFGQNLPVLGLVLFVPAVLALYYVEELAAPLLDGGESIRSQAIVAGAVLVYIIAVAVVVDPV